MFHIMDDQWPRREHFRHYMDNMRCTYSFTVQIDITKLRGALKANGIKAYPAQIFMLTSAVNRLPEFRLGMTEQGAPGYWETAHPSYTIFNPSTKTFSSIWTHCAGDFASFYRACTEDIRRYSTSTAFAAKRGQPLNTFTVSSVPWVNFTAFNLNVYTDGRYLAPIFTIGKYTEQGNKTYLPLAIQLHHAACDGYHAGQFVEVLRDMAQAYHNWF